VPRNRPRDDDYEDDDYEDDEAPRKKKAKSRRPRRRGNQALWLVGALAIVVLAASAAGAVIWALGGRPKPATATTAPERPAKGWPRERFIGSWEYISPDHRARMTLDVRAGELTLSGFHPGGGSTIVIAPWEVLSEANAEQMKTRVRFGQPADWGIDFLPNDEMRVNFLSGNSPPVIYKRVR
jgi:hypothetical protein